MNIEEQIGENQELEMGLGNFELIRIRKILGKTMKLGIRNGRILTKTVQRNG